MKKISIFLCSLALIICSCNNSNENKETKSKDLETAKSTSTETTTSDGRYAIEKAKVVTETELPSNMGKTVNTLWFEKFGNTSYTESETKLTMKGMPPSKINCSITQDGIIYSWIKGEKKGSKMNIDLVDDNLDMDYEKMGEEMMKQYHISRDGNETFLDRECSRYKMDNPKLGKGTILIWKNIALKTDITMSGMHVVNVVTEIDENPDLSQATFKIPDDINFMEINIKGGVKNH